MGIGLALVLMVAARGPASKPDDPLRVLLQTGHEPWQVALREKEPLERWHQIHWVPVKDATRLAQAQGKPLLLSISSGSLGRAKSPFT
jgi:hypothetical protein